MGTGGTSTRVGCGQGPDCGAGPLCRKEWDRELALLCGEDGWAGDKAVGLLVQ